MPGDPLTADDAIAGAIRLLAFAEASIGNIALMERYEKLADSWVSLAHLLAERERV